MNRRDLFKILGVAGAAVAVPAVLAEPPLQAPKVGPRSITIPPDFPVGSMITVVNLGPDNLIVYGPGAEFVRCS